MIYCNNCAYRNETTNVCSKYMVTLPYIQSLRCDYATLDTNKIILEKPLIVRTKEECRNLEDRIPGVGFNWYLEDRYPLPCIIYSDSGNYTSGERYLHNNLASLPKSRREEIEKYISLQLYECIKCHNIDTLDSYTDVECDGDVTGICPKCGNITVMWDTSIEEDKY